MSSWEIRGIRKGSSEAGLEEKESLWFSWSSSRGRGMAQNGVTASRTLCCFSQERSLEAAKCATQEPWALQLTPTDCN